MYPGELDQNKKTSLPSVQRALNKHGQRRLSAIVGLQTVKECLEIVLLDLNHTRLEAVVAE